MPTLPLGAKPILSTLLTFGSPGRWFITSSAGRTFLWPTLRPSRAMHSNCLRDRALAFGYSAGRYRAAWGRCRRIAGGRRAAWRAHPFAPFVGRRAAMGDTQQQRAGNRANSPACDSRGRAGHLVDAGARAVCRCRHIAPGFTQHRRPGRCCGSSGGGRPIVGLRHGLWPVGWLADH